MKIGAMFEDYYKGEHGRKTLTLVGGRGAMTIDMLLEGDKGDRVALAHELQRADVVTLGEMIADWLASAESTLRDDGIGDVTKVL
jgi:hypothetical protein